MRATFFLRFYGNVILEGTKVFEVTNSFQPHSLWIKSKLTNNRYQVEQIVTGRIELDPQATGTQTPVSLYVDFYVVIDKQGFAQYLIRNHEAFILGNEFQGFEIYDDENLDIDFIDYEVLTD